MKKNIGKLQEEIDRIGADPRKKPTPEAISFVEILCSKLFEIDAPTEVGNLLRANVTRIHIDYNMNNFLDMAALNNKVAQIAEIARPSAGADSQLSEDIEKQILRIMSAKQ